MGGLKDEMIARQLFSLDDLKNSMLFQSTPGGAAIGYPNISRPGMLFAALGGEKRQPYPSEKNFFSQNPSVSGMATEDGRVTLNPYSPLSMQEKQYVAVNEALRNLLNQTPLNFPLTPAQSGYLSGTNYANAPDHARKATILARILSGDPGAQTPTQEQLNALGDVLRQRR